jgi:alkylated DNA nucleotide flippase Atl1
MDLKRIWIVVGDIVHHVHLDSIVPWPRIVSVMYAQVVNVSLGYLLAQHVLYRLNAQGISPPSLIRDPTRD